MARLSPWKKAIIVASLLVVAGYFGFRKYAEYATRKGPLWNFLYYTHLDSINILGFYTGDTARWINLRGGVSNYLDDRLLSETQMEQEFQALCLFVDKHRDSLRSVAEVSVYQLFDRCPNNLKMREFADSLEQKLQKQCSYTILADENGQMYGVTYALNSSTP